MKNNENPLGYAPISGLILKFALPSILSLLVTSAYNITDQIFIGNVVGMLGNAATNVAFPVVTLTGALAQVAFIGNTGSFNSCIYIDIFQTNTYYLRCNRSCNALCLELS